MMTLKISFNIDLPDTIEHTDNELRDYLRYYYGMNGGLELDNPFEKWQSGMPERVYNLQIEKEN